jgi:TatA/E family protein of Tat protein translocase
MPQVGPAEILVILLVALLVFGPKRLPEIGRQVGRGLHELKKFQDTVKGELDDVLKLGDHDAVTASTPENSTQLAANDPTRALPAATAGAVAVPARPSHAPSRFRAPVPEPAPSPANGRDATPAPAPAASPAPPPAPAREPSRAPSRFRAPGPTA